VEQFCRHSHLSLDQLRQTTFADFGKLELLDKIFAFLHIPHVTPLGFSQQFEAQHSLPEKIYFVAGCWRCTLTFNMWRRLSARTKRSGLEWRFAYVRQHFKVKSGKPSRVLLPLFLGFLAFKPSPKTQRKVREACWAISPPPRWTSSKAFL